MLEALKMYVKLPKLVEKIEGYKNKGLTEFINLAEEVFSEIMKMKY